MLLEAEARRDALFVFESAAYFADQCVAPLVDSEPDSSVATIEPEAASADAAVTSAVELLFTKLVPTTLPYHAELYVSNQILYFETTNQINFVNQI